MLDELVALAAREPTFLLVLVDMAVAVVGMAGFALGIPPAMKLYRYLKHNDRGTWERVYGTRMLVVPNPLPLFRYFSKHDNDTGNVQKWKRQAWAALLIGYGSIAVFIVLLIVVLAISLLGG